MTSDLVAIFIPVFNGGPMLDACIQSVIGQSHRDWKLIVSDNASSDDSVAIAQRHAAADSRICLVAAGEHLPMMDHWNRSLQALPDDVEYYKQLHVDDVLGAKFLERLVDAGRRHPDANLFGAYFRYGKKQLPLLRHRYEVSVAGMEAVKPSFFGAPSYLFHPSAMLARRSAVPDWSTLYVDNHFPSGYAKIGSGLADVNAFLPVAESGRVVFVPEILSEIADREDSTTATLQRVGGWHASRIDTILRFGPRYLDRNEFRRALKVVGQKYVLSMCWRFLRAIPWRDSEFCQYQSLALNDLLGRLDGFDSWELRMLARFCRVIERTHQASDQARET
jgi:hypothetical protein